LGTFISKLAAAQPVLLHRRVAADQQIALALVGMLRRAGQGGIQKAAAYGRYGSSQAAFGVCLCGRAVDHRVTRFEAF